MVVVVVSVAAAACAVGAAVRWRRQKLAAAEHEAPRVPTVRFHLPGLGHNEGEGRSLSARHSSEERNLSTNGSQSARAQIEVEEEEDFGNDPDFTFLKSKFAGLKRENTSLKEKLRRNCWHVEDTLKERDSLNRQLGTVSQDLQAAKRRAETSLEAATKAAQTATKMVMAANMDLRNS